MLTGGNNIDTWGAVSHSAKRIDKPEFVIPISTSKDIARSKLGQWERETSKAIVELFGAVGGVTNNSVTHANWLKKGAVDFDTYVKEKVINFMLTNPRVQEYWAYDVSRVLNTTKYVSDHSALLKVIYSNEVLRNRFNLVNNLTEEDKKYILIWKELLITRAKHRPLIDTELMKVVDHLASIPIHPANTVLLTYFVNNKFLSIINTDELGKLAQNNATSKVAVELLTTVLNN